MTKWYFWGEKEFSDVYENIYIRSFIEDWFGIINIFVKAINIHKAKTKKILDIGCGEGHTTKQILDRVEGDYICDLLEPNTHALSSAKAFLSIENKIGELFQKTLSAFSTEKKYDIIFTSHTNYYWAANETDFKNQLAQLPSMLEDGGKLMILTLPKDSGHYLVMLRQIYPEFNYAEYIASFYKQSGFNVNTQELCMRIYVGDILTTKSTFDLKVFYKFIHNTDIFPNDDESRIFLSKIKEYQKDGYIDFKDWLITVTK
jgi:trans-aconitate methyltransferase